MRKEIQRLWDILSNTNCILHLERSVQSLVFSHQARASPRELVRTISLEMVHTWKGQWDGIVGDSDDDKVAQRHQIFLLCGTTTPLMTLEEAHSFVFGTFSPSDLMIYTTIDMFYLTTVVQRSSVLSFSERFHWLTS